MVLLPGLVWLLHRRGLRRDRSQGPAPAPRTDPPGRSGTDRREQSSVRAAVEGGLEVGRQRRARRRPRSPRERVREGEPRRVEELALEPELARPAVDRVAADRQVDRGEVDADLVRAPGLERDAQERVPRQQLLDLEVRDRLARRVGVERVPQRVAPVAPDRGVDRAAPRPRPADDEREVLARRARATGRAPASRRCASGERATTSRPEVSRSSRWTIPGRSGSSPPSTSCASRPCTSVPCACPGAGWTTSPAGLSTTSRCSSSYGTARSIASGVEPARRRRRRLELQLLAAGEPAALRPRTLPSTSTPPSRTSRSAAAREPISGSAARKRSSRSPAALVRNAQSRHAARGAAHARRRAARRAGSRRRSTMKLSARLNAGQ